jgi:hypothetical protein
MRRRIRLFIDFCSDQKQRNENVAKFNFLAPRLPSWPLGSPELTQRPPRLRHETRGQRGPVHASGQGVQRKQ